MKKFVRTATILAGALALAAVSQAVPLSSLNTLVGGSGSITSGDKVFSGFTCLVTSSTGFVSGGCNGDISPIVDADGNVGIEISDFFSAGGVNGSTLDVRLNYTVSTLSQAATISDVHMSFDSSAPSANARAVVSETVCPAGSPSLCSLGSRLAFIQVSDQATAAGEALTLSAAADLSSIVASARVFKDIGLTADVNGFVSFSILTQTFSQTTVPEPGSIALLGTALLGCAALLRRRAKKSA